MGPFGGGGCLRALRSGTIALRTECLWSLYYIALIYSPKKGRSLTIPNCPNPPRMVEQGAGKVTGGVLGVYGPFLPSCWAWTGQVRFFHTLWPCSGGCREGLGDPPGVKMALFRPKWAKMTQFGGVWGCVGRSYRVLGVRNFGSNVWELTSFFGPRPPTR